MRNGRSAAYYVAGLSLLMAASAVVCSAQMMPPSDSSGYSAKVVEMTGRVSVLRDATAWALNTGDLVHVQELILTGPDGQAKFEVSDGSTFEVYPNSRVVFRKNPPNWRDLLDVLVGRVKVHIEHLYGPNPNRVQTPTAVISVRGTTFDVSVDDDDESTEVAVEEGVVEVRHAMLPGNTKTLTAGETYIVYRNVPIASSRFDKGAIAKRSIRMIVDAISTWESRMPRAGTIGTTISPSAPSTTKTPTSTAPAPAPPPPVAPPPPAPVAPSAPGFIDTSNGPAVSVFVVRQPESRWHKVTHAIWNAMVRFALGPEPGLDVMQAIQR
ncbi:MAG TPA: FecR family protein [Bryobacteraceae bacterium]|nr:FecR family protein [Bryobacteraceae bacterium]